MPLFKDKTLLQHESNLAAFLPPGLAFAASQSTESNFGKFIAGLATELRRAYDDVNNISEDYDILVTNELLSKWESAVGIPDASFSGTGSHATRRLQVLLKFAKMNVQTAPQMVDLAVALGFVDVTIQALQDSAFPPYNVPFVPCRSPESRYIIIVYATNAITNIPPYNVPFTPAADNTSLLNLVLQIVKPANVEILFGNYTPPAFVPTILPNCALWLDAGDASTLTLSGVNLVNFWADKATNNNASEVVIPPSYISSYQNGYGVVRFSNAQSMEIIGSSIYDTVDGDNTTFVVIRQNAGSDTDYVLSYGAGSNDTGFIRYQNTAVSVGDDPVQCADLPTTNFEVIRTRRAGLLQGVAINGGDETTNLLAATPIDPTDGAFIGSHLGTNDFATADIAEIIIYDRSLTESEREKVENYLFDKWAIL